MAYMLMTRLGLRADDYFTADEFAHVYEFNTPPTVNALGIATSDIAEMGLREISRTVMQAQRDQFFANRVRIGYDDRTEQHETPHERSEQHGGHLQDAERLSGAEPADAADAGGASGKYAELRREYLKKHRRVLYTNLKTSGKLTEHLAEIEQTARKMVEQTVAQMARARA